MNKFINNKFTSSIFSISKSRFNESIIDAKAFVKEGKLILIHLVRAIYVLGGKITPSWVRVTRMFLKKLCLIRKYQGRPGVVKYLKSASVVLQQILSGMKIKDMSGIGPRIKRGKQGLPSIIPITHRRQIMSGDIVIIRM